MNDDGKRSPASITIEIKGNPCPDCDQICGHAYNCSRRPPPKVFYLENKRREERGDG